MIINPVQYQLGVKLPELENPGTAADLLAGKQLVDQYGNPLTGTMPEVEQAVPSISVSSSGLITASAAQNAGHVAAGTKSATSQLTTQAGKTVTPGTSRQTAVASGRYTTGAVYVAGDANLKAENIKDGVSIFGVTGTLTSGVPIIEGIIHNNTGINIRIGFVTPTTAVVAYMGIENGHSAKITTYAYATMNAFPADSSEKMRMKASSDSVNCKSPWASLYGDLNIFYFTESGTVYIIPVGF